MPTDYIFYEEDKEIKLVERAIKKAQKKNCLES